MNAIDTIFLDTFFTLRKLEKSLMNNRVLGLLKSRFSKVTNHLLILFFEFGIYLKPLEYTLVECDAVEITSSSTQQKFYKIVSTKDFLKSIF